RYPFPWPVVADFVLSEKAKGPPDDNVRLQMDETRYFYHVRMPWYARLVLGKEVIWVDDIIKNKQRQVLLEIGQNFSNTDKGTITDLSEWFADPRDPANATLYTKIIEIHITYGW
ncbi:unnamed protein product, partial [Phaeothamnion confervicola]